jgi:hypothetical protein
MSLQFGEIDQAKVLLSSHSITRLQWQNRGLPPDTLGSSPDASKGHAASSPLRGCEGVDAPLDDEDLSDFGPI